MYGFDRQRRVGEAYERKFDAHFSQDYDIQEVGMRLQRQGVDRIFSKGNRRWKVEYKANTTAARTGCMFVELESAMGRPGKRLVRGWFVTTKADILIYYVPPHNIAHIYDMRRLRVEYAKQRAWLKGTPQEIPNNGYTTWGIAVPFGVLSNARLRSEPIL